MNRFVQEGDAIDYTPEDDVDAGQIVVLGSLVGITKLPIAAGETGALALKGVFEGDKADGVAFAAGAPVYFDTGDGNLNGTSSGNTLAGYAVADAAEDDTTVRFRLAN